MVRRRGPDVDIPIRPPASDSTGPPSSAPSLVSSRISASMRPPAWLCQASPSACTIANRAVVPPASSAPTKRVRLPTRTGSAAAGSGPVQRRRPASAPRRSFQDRARPAPLRPFCRRTRPEAPKCPRGSICSDATTTSGRHRIPLADRWPVRIATTNARRRGDPVGEIGRKLLDTDPCVDTLLVVAAPCAGSAGAGIGRMTGTTPRQMAGCRHDGSLPIWADERKSFHAARCIESGSGSVFRASGACVRPRRPRRRARHRIRAEERPARRAGFGGDFHA